MEAYARSLAPLQSSPQRSFHAALLALQSTIEALLTSLSRPPRLIQQIAASRRTAERNYASVGRSTRWPLGLLDDTRQRLNEEREERAKRGEREADDLGRELRYTQQVVAAELAGWRTLHEQVGRRAVRELARGMLVVERMRLEGMKRALRRVREANRQGPGSEIGARIAVATVGKGDTQDGEGAVENTGENGIAEDIGAAAEGGTLPADNVTREGGDEEVA